MNIVEQLKEQKDSMDSGIGTGHFRNFRSVESDEGMILHL